ncbi:unnamed protein product, partial [Gulo gulo]
MRNDPRPRRCTSHPRRWTAGTQVQLLLSCGKTENQGTKEVLLDGAHKRLSFTKE